MLHNAPQTGKDYFANHKLDANIAAFAYDSLYLELHTFPKPGLVSHIDNGAHKDMDCHTLEASAKRLMQFFGLFYLAGLANPTMSMLRCIGLKAESAMLQVTHNVNTHKGAIFSFGLICAAYGLKQQYNLFEKNLGTIIRENWAKDILPNHIYESSYCHENIQLKPIKDNTIRLAIPTHGEEVFKQYGIGGARLEAAMGFPTLYNVGLPALREASLLNDCPEAQRIHVLMRLIAVMQDTNLLYRGGSDGLEFAQNAANLFLRHGSIANDDWKKIAIEMHHNFKEKNLSPGGAADLLAATLFLNSLGEV